MIPLFGLHLSIPVLDVRKAAEVYSELFSLEIKSVTDDLAQLYFGHCRISLKRVDEGSSSLQRDAAQSVRARHVGFSTTSKEDLVLLFKRAVALGLHIVSEPKDRGHSEMCFFFLDDSGNQIEVFSESLWHEKLQ